jgi:hypothetical protein
MPPVGFEPTISAGEQPQTYVLGRTANGTGYKHITSIKFLIHWCGITFEIIAARSTEIALFSGFVSKLMKERKGREFVITLLVSSAVKKAGSVLYQEVIRTLAAP